MAYDPCKLVRDVRIYLGGVPESKLPETVIIHWGDFYDNPCYYENNYPYILWKTTLSCLDYLRAEKATSESSAAKSSRTEKVGDVQITISEDSSSESATAISYDDLYEDYLNNPWKFGIKLPDKASYVLINGVDQQEVEEYRTNQNTTSIYNPLSVTQFPKTTGQGATERRRKLLG